METVYIVATAQEVIPIELRHYIPMWDKLSPAEQDDLSRHAFRRSVEKGTILHNGNLDCTGLFVIISGQLRSYILSDEGREITIYRLFERDICLFSASCIMSSIQFEVIIEAEKDSEIWIIPPMIYKRVMEQSAPLANFTNQLMATQSILKKANRMVLKAHMDCCVREAAVSGDPDAKLEELALLLDKLTN